MFDSLLLILSVMFLMMFGGWLLCLCSYRGVLFGFVYGLCSSVFKSIVMSKKSTIFRLASIVILILFSLKILKISFLIFSVCLGVLSHSASPSPLYRIIIIINNKFILSPNNPSSSVDCTKSKTQYNYT